MKRLLLLPVLLMLPLSTSAQFAESTTPVESGTPVDVRDGDDVFMTHSNDLTVAHGGVACFYSGAGSPTQENNYWRVFDTADFGAQGNVEITAIMHGVANNDAINDQMFFFYLLDGPLEWDNLDILDVLVFTVTPDDVGEVLVLELDDPVVIPAGGTLALQLHIPDSGDDYTALAGFNSEGQTDPTYIHSDACGISDPTPLEAVNPAWDIISWVVAAIGKDVVLDGEGTATTRSIALGAAFPNPSTGMTTLPITLEEDTHVRVTIHDVLGRQVGLAFDDVMLAGEQSVNVNTGTLASGTYVVRMAAGTEVLSNRIVVVR